MRIVYMGTPEFSVASLSKLLSEKCNVVGVVTAPDKPAGRGRKIRTSALKQFLQKLDRGIPVLQPDNLKDPGFLKKLTDLQPHLMVVVAFRMLPETVWRIPRLGTFNLHASLLPQYRGAAPIHHVIINGETETGVTTFMIDEQIDTGSILLQKRTAISEQETAGSLHDRLMSMGAELVLETVKGLAAGNLQSQPQDNFVQDEMELKKAPKIHTDFCRIDWDRPAQEVYNLIRGLSPYPTAFAFLDKPGGERVLCKIYSSSYETDKHPDAPGSIISDGKKFLKVAVNNGYIQIHSMQQEGKRKMEVRDFLAGINFSSGLFRFS